MGLYDRDYGRYESQTPWDRAQNPRSMTITLIVINVVIFFLDMIMASRDPATGMSTSLLADWFAVTPETLVKPWLWWQFLTYGFIHDSHSINHILFNMFGLFIFGRMVEQRIGGPEFLRFYLVSVFIGGIAAAIVGAVQASLYGVPLNQFPGTIGASGAVVAVTILFACYYPHTELLLMFVLPVKAWVLATVFVLYDFAGALGLTGAGNTAFEVHLMGALFAFVYYYQHWNLSWLNFEAVADYPQRMRQRSRRMKLKVHDPDKKLRQEAAEADRILAKIHQQGESSLTAAERRVLERYSRRQRERKNP